MKRTWILLALFALGAGFLWMRGAPPAEGQLPEPTRSSTSQVQELESSSVAGSARVENSNDTAAASLKPENGSTAVSELVEVDEFDLELEKRIPSEESWGSTVLSFEKPDVYAKDPKFNPAGVELGPEDLAELRALIGRLNERLRLSRNEIGTLVTSHIQDKIDRGEAVFTTDGSEPDSRSLGLDGICVASARGGASYCMRMKQGDFADLDRAQYRISAFVKLGEEWIARAFQ